MRTLLLLSLFMMACEIRFVPPTPGKFVYYGDSIVSTGSPAYIDYVEAQGYNVNTAAIPGAKMDAADPTNTIPSVEEQTLAVVPVGGVVDGCQTKMTLEGVPDVTSCISMIEWDPCDFVVIQAGTNDVFSPLYEFLPLGPVVYQAALENVLSEIAVIPIENRPQCIVTVSPPVTCTASTCPTANDRITNDLPPAIDAAIASALPACEVLDLNVAFLNYGATFGSAALDALFADGVHLNAAGGMLAGDLAIELAEQMVAEENECRGQLIRVEP